MATSGFTMYGAREAISGGLAHIAAQVDAIERAVVENPGLTFDLAKTVVESACKTILASRNLSFSDTDDLPKLFKTVSRSLPILPVEASSEIEARKSLERTLSGLHNALQGVCELRNAYGFASHGAAGPRPSMESIQALLAAQAADTIVGFLHRIHHQDTAVRTVPKLAYDTNEPFNSYVDDVNDVVRIFEMEYRPSEVLFQVDQEAYRNSLVIFQSGERDGTEVQEEIATPGVPA